MAARLDSQRSAAGDGTPGPFRPPVLSVGSETLSAVSRSGPLPQDERLFRISQTAQPWLTEGDLIAQPGEQRLFFDRGAQSQTPMFG